MAKPSSSNTILEERKDFMVSPFGDSKPALRKAYFLKPTATSMEEPELPSDSISPLSPQTLQRNNCPLKSSSMSWVHPNQDWITWVSRMQSKHQAAWKKSGIDQAILNSTYDIKKSIELIIGLSEKWCPNTNTFVFPWGEATITLEDVIILGGYSVLGSPVSCFVENREWDVIEEKMMDARMNIVRSRARKACQHAWMKKFSNGGSEIEHEAFLALWLSRTVFQNSSHTIRKQVFPIAICLARGIPIALAPAVLASIYRDLSRLKRAIVAGNNESRLELFSPVQLVQFWAWERFPILQPKPDVLNFGDPRSARWDRAKIPKIPKVENVRLTLDSAAESFLWRPYAKSLKNWSFPEFYRENEELVLADSGFDIHLESFIRCLRVSKILGLDYMENYSPHRVAMQFGMDQDLPGRVNLDKTREIAWMNYNKPTSDTKLYIPSRLSESNVTTRYLKWWEQMVLGKNKKVSGSSQQQRSAKRSKPDLQVSKGEKTSIDPDVPPGFRPKNNMNESRISAKKDKPAAVEMLAGNNQQSFGNEVIANGELRGQSQCNFTSNVHDGTDRNMEPPSQSAQNISGGEATMGAAGRATDQTGGGQENTAAGNTTSNRLSINGNAGESNGYKLDIAELENWITLLERKVAKLKAARRLGAQV
ncbi:hypothetical protein OIU78_017684 [Salix suchowensis]|nr:hypothetical protein OIU78_017684 [Salix suchowensis]